MMIQKISRYCALLLAYVGVFGVLLVGSSTSATAGTLFPDAAQQACSGAQLDDKAGACATGEDKLEGIIKAALNILSIAAGVAAVIMIVIAGIRYVTSQGDSAGISGAKNTIIYAVVGLVIVALAQIIVKFVIDEIG
jgi:hypothetical protein